MALTGELDLSALLSSMSPTLDPQTYTFATLPSAICTAQTLVRLLPHTEMLFKESEGWTFILAHDEAAKWKTEWPDLESNFPCRKITLNVHSSLDAVGFLAKITSRLAERVKVGVNPVSGYFHDHLFVPVGREEDVMAELAGLGDESRKAVEK